MRTVFYDTQFCFSPSILCICLNQGATYNGVWAVRVAQKGAWAERDGFPFPLTAHTPSPNVTPAPPSLPFPCRIITQMVPGFLFFVVGQFTMFFSAITREFVVASVRGRRD